MSDRRNRYDTAEKLRAERERKNLANARLRADTKHRRTIGAPPREHLHVDGQRLAVYLRQYVADWESSHGWERGGARHERVVFERLSERCATAGGTVSPKMLREICAGRRTRVLLYETADPILCAIGMPELLHTEFEVKQSQPPLTLAREATGSDMRRVAA